MQIRLTVGRVGTGFAQEPGQVIDLPDAEANRLIASQQAEPAVLKTGQVAETAAIDVKKVETRIRRSKR